MFLCKTQSKGNLIQKIHNGQIISTASQNQLVIVTENSIEVLVYEYDDVLSQYTTSSILNQTFPFKILDSTIISSKLLLLTVCGLVLFDYIDGSIIPIDNILFNITGEPRDHLMYLKANKSGEIAIVYSNTNLFFLYIVKNNKLLRRNNQLFVTNFNICNAFLIKLTNNSFGISVLTKNNKDYRIDNFFLDNGFDTDKEISVESLSDERKHYVQLMTLLNEKLNTISGSDIYDLVFSPKMQFVFLISENNLITLKIFSSEKIEIVSQIDFKTPKYYVSSFNFGGNFIQLTFDNQVYLFQEESDSIKKCKIRPKGNKSSIKGFNALLLTSESFIILFYDYQSSLYFAQYSKPTIEGEINMNIITENINQSLFTFDSAVIQSEDKNSIYSICGLKGNSRLIKYEDTFIEIKLKETRLLNVNNILISPCCDENTKLCLFSYIDKASLFTIGQNFTINPLQDFDDIIIDLYCIPSQIGTYVLLFKNSVSIIQIDTNTNKEESLSCLPTIKSEVEIPLNSKQAIILSSSHSSSSNGLFYLVCYLISNEILISSIDSKYDKIKEEARLDLGEQITISSMACIHTEASVISLIIGTYQSYLQLIHYDINAKKFNILKEHKYDIVPDTCSDKIIPENIKTIDNYIFITTRTGEFCALVYKYDTKKLECFMSNKFTTASLCLRISNIEKTQNGYSLDLFNELSAFNFLIDIEPNMKVYKKKYLIKKTEDGMKSENNSIVFFKKIFIKNLVIHMYQNGSDFSFAYFPVTNKNMIINDIYYFNKEETARRILSISNEILVILTDANKLYIYSPNLFKFISEYKLDSMDKLFIYSMKEAKIRIPNENKTMSCICLCGEYYDQTLKEKKGVLFVYEFSKIKGGLNIIVKIPKFPKPIYDVCCTKNYFVTGMEGYICILPYEIDPKTSNLVLRKEAKQQQYLNKIISLYSIDNLSNIVLVGDIKESFQLIDFEQTQSRFDISAADMSNRSLAKAIPINNSKSEVLLIEKNCSITKFKLNNELYEQSNSIDLKEYINNCHQIDDLFFCTGLLGSLIIIKEFSDKISEEFGITHKRIDDLANFQKEIIKKMSMYYFKAEIPIEKMMQMSCPLKNVILLDILDSIRRNQSNLMRDIPGYEELFKLISFLMEEVI